MLVRLITKFLMSVAGYDYEEPLPTLLREPRPHWFSRKVKSRRCVDSRWT